jgi:glucose/arabinose dehydrogenase
LHPDFPSQPYIYVAYNYLQGTTKERVVRYTYNNNVLQTPLTLIEDIAGSGIHNGCRLLTLGDKLFITTGDAANQSLPQNLQSVNGKMLRLNLDGSIPADNPIAGNPAWSWGHRNAQGLVYANGRMYISEHGPTTDDEVSIVDKGRNYGWPTVHGFCNTAAEITFCNDSNVVEPLMAWTPTIAVCGLDYYNHPMFPAWQNSLLMATLKDQDLYQLKLNSTYDSIVSSTVIVNNTFGRLRDVCVAPNGKIYISTSNSGLTNKIIEIYDPSFVSVEDITASSEITVYPNPVGDYTVVRLPNEEGKIVAKGIIDTNNATISTKRLARGVYNIRISGESGKVYNGKIMKQ